MFQDPYESLDPRYRVRDTVAEPLVIHRIGSRAERGERVREALERAGLSPAELFLDRYPHELSGGQRQRVAIAAALVLEPKLLVADEPVSMLDVSVRAGILDLLDGLRRGGLGILMITHDLSTATQYADRIMVMYLGRIVEEGPARDGRRQPAASVHQGADLGRAATRPARPARGRRSCRARRRTRSTSRAGCRFHPRCPIGDDACRAVDPQLEPATRPSRGLHQAVTGPLGDWLPQSRLVLPQTDVPLPLVPAIDAHNHLGRWLGLWDDWLGARPGRYRARRRAALGGRRRRRADRDARRGRHRGDRQPRRPLGRRARAQPRPLRPRAPRAASSRSATSTCAPSAARASTPASSSRACGARATPARAASRSGRTSASGSSTRAARSCCPTTSASRRSSPRPASWTSPCSSTRPTRSRSSSRSTARNERLEELLEKPEWSYFGRGFPSFDRLMASLEALVAAHPGHDLHRRPRRLLPREPRLGRPHARDLPEHGHRRLAAHGRARPPAARRRRA